MAYIFKDLNVRDPFVSSSNAVLLEDTKVVIQSLWRLLNTQEGEIPNFRNYGLDIKQFSQYPLNEGTVKGIQKYVEDRINAFESRAEVVKTYADFDVESGKLMYVFYVRVKSTNELVALPTWSVTIASLK